MKTCPSHPYRLAKLIAGLGLMLTGPVTAQTFSTLYSFTAPSPSYPSTNGDGAAPIGGLVLSGCTLYGTASYGGISGGGTVFAVNTDGSRFTNLLSFAGSDGSGSKASLILSGGTLYGTTAIGGDHGWGTVFEISTNGTGYENVNSFSPISLAIISPKTNSDGANPLGGVILSSNTLYGTASYGGTSANGTIFAVHFNHNGFPPFTNLHNFTASGYPTFANSDGGRPSGGLVLAGNTLYGTAEYGGAYAGGTVFAINTDGTAFTNLHSFGTIVSNTDSDGASPRAGLILSGNTLYGTASKGGNSGYGTVFAINTDGTGFTNLHSFIGSDGNAPQASLVLSGNTLYGTTLSGGGAGSGTVFAVDTNGTAFTTLYSFTSTNTDIADVYTNGDGALPYASLIISGYTLYGTASQGGSSGYGTVFSLSYVPQLTIIPSGANVILSWPTNVGGFDYSGFTLVSTTNLASPASWAIVSPGPVVVNGQNIVTNPVSGAQQFYWLSLGN